MQETNALRNRIRDAACAFTYETFEKGHVSYLEDGASLLETLDSLTAAEASAPIAESGTSIASHAEHVRFYVADRIQSFRGEETGEVDWQQSWKVQTVTAEQWDALRNALREAYQELQSVLHGFETWEIAGQAWGAIAVIAHSAYHLGAIRLALQKG